MWSTDPIMQPSRPCATAPRRLLCGAMPWLHSWGWPISPSPRMMIYGDGLSPSRQVGLLLGVFGPSKVGEHRGKGPFQVKGRLCLSGQDRGTIMGLHRDRPATVVLLQTSWLVHSCSSRLPPPAFGARTCSGEPLKCPAKRTRRTSGCPVPRKEHQERRGSSIARNDKTADNWYSACQGGASDHDDADRSSGGGVGPGLRGRSVGKVGCVGEGHRRTLCAPAEVSGGGRGQPTRGSLRG